MRIEEILAENNIDIPRLRGVDFMEIEEPISDEELATDLRWAEMEAADSAIRSDGIWVTYSSGTDALCEYYMCGKSHKWHGIRWERLHGKLRKRVKFEIKKAKRRTIRQIEMWNRYVGQKVIHVEARIGEGAWTAWRHTDFIGKSWYLDSCVNRFDKTYADIYINVDYSDEDVKEYQREIDELRKEILLL